ncbi:hypothetical protein BGZ70_001912 [Mortierella alpina]|uniref:Uncharacterized protein n=1 Tax=Mortierella alpina TaxID=64518 RepID=A0A9P6LWJ0_MORAP|nr:hypothetical protein BGZ70_001912 [Mortierella alpina]
MTTQDPSALTSSVSNPKAQSVAGGTVSLETIKVVANDGTQHYYPQRQVYTQPSSSTSSSSSSLPPVQKRESVLATSETATVATDTDTDTDTDDPAISASSKTQYCAPVNPRLPTGYVYPMPTLLRPGVGVGEVRCHYDRQRSGLLHCTNGYSYALIAPKADVGASSDQTATSSSSTASSSASSSSSAKKPWAEKRSSAAEKPGSSEVPKKKRSMAPTGETAPNPAASGAKSGPGSAAAMGVGPVGSGDPFYYAPTTAGVESSEPRSKFCGEGAMKGTDWWHAFGAESASGADGQGRSKYAGSETMWGKSGAASTGTEARAACATCGVGTKAGYGQGHGQGQAQAQAEGSGKKTKKTKQVKRAVSAPGGHGQDAVSVPIHIPLLWDGTKVVSPPGYGGQFDAGVEYPLDADTEVVAVPINIAALVAPDGTMTLLPSN